ncbi:hypothetical protein BGZ94_009138 [Podila epigama]|nr:hypothetical protein BGZ94_009138 [Podila epigama]
MREQFPKDQEFFIRLRDTDYVIDVSGGHADPGTAILLYTQKPEDNENQKWIYEDKQLKNKQTGLVLTFPELRPHLVASHHGQGEAAQKFDYYDYTISNRDNEDLVIGINGAKADNAPIALIPRDNDSDLQQWEIVLA